MWLLSVAMGASLTCEVEPTYRVVLEDGGTWVLPIDPGEGCGPGLAHYALVGPVGHDPGPCWALRVDSSETWSHRGLHNVEVAVVCGASPGHLEVRATRALRRTYSVGFPEVAHRVSFDDTLSLSDGVLHIDGTPWPWFAPEPARTVRDERGWRLRDGGVTYTFPPDAIAPRSWDDLDVLQRVDATHEPRWLVLATGPGVRSVAWLHGRRDRTLALYDHHHLPADADWHIDEDGIVLDGERWTPGAPVATTSEGQLVAYGQRFPLPAPWQDARVLGHADDRPFYGCWALRRTVSPALAQVGIACPTPGQAPVVATLDLHATSDGTWPEVRANPRAIFVDGGRWPWDGRPLAEGEWAAPGVPGPQRPPTSTPVPVQVTASQPTHLVCDGQHHTVDGPLVLQIEAFRLPATCIAMMGRRKAAFQVKRHSTVHCTDLGDDLACTVRETTGQ